MKHNQIDMYTLNYLPNELIYEILKNLTFQELYNKRTTNKLFLNVYKFIYKTQIKKHIFKNNKIFLPIEYNFDNHKLIRPIEYFHELINLFEYTVTNFKRVKKTRDWYVYLKDNKTGKIYKKQLFYRKQKFFILFNINCK